MNREAPAANGNDVEKRAKALLDESVEHLDGHTLSRLTQARHAALDEVQRSRQSIVRRWWLPASGVAVAAVAIFFLTRLQGVPRSAGRRSHRRRVSDTPWTRYAPLTSS